MLDRVDGLLQGYKCVRLIILTQVRVIYVDLFGAQLGEMKVKTVYCIECLCTFV